MMTYGISYLVSLLVLVGLDYLRLGVIMQSRIQSWLGPLMRESLAYGPALAFYCLYTVAILAFAVRPAVVQSDRTVALGYGALLGFTAYMTYDLTNRATLKNWPVTMVLPDILR